jgi:hypothetical protein
LQRKEQLLSTVSIIVAATFLLVLSQTAYSQTVGNQNFSLPGFLQSFQKDISGHYSNPQFGITDIVFPVGWHGISIPTYIGLLITMSPGNQSLEQTRLHPIQPAIMFQVLNNSDLPMINSITSKLSPVGFSIAKNCKQLAQNSTSVIDGKTFRVMTIECPFSSLMSSAANTTTPTGIGNQNNTNTTYYTINPNGVGQSRIYEYKTSDRTYILALIVSSPLFSSTSSSDKPDISKYISLIDATANTLKLK